MTLFDRSHMSSYELCIVTMAISCIICEIQVIGPKSRFSTNKSRLRYYSTSDNSQLVQDRAIVTMAD